MSEHLPAFGPSETFGGVDDLEPAVAVVRVAFALTRTQLATVLAMAFTSLGPDRAPESLTDAEVRNEIEAQLAAEAIIEVDRQMEHDQAATFSPEQQQALDVLAAAVDRAYAPRPAPAVQSPRYREGTVTLQTLDHGEVTIPEPGWCTGHDGDLVGDLADVSHDGPPVQAALHGDTPVMQAHISHAPYLQIDPEPHPVLAVHLDYSGDLGPAEGRALSRTLRAASARLDRVLAEVAHLRGDNR